MSTHADLGLDPQKLYERVRALTDENHRLAERNARLEQTLEDLRREVRRLNSEPYREIGPKTEMGAIALQDVSRTGGNVWDPVYWESRGFKRNFGDAAVMSPYFEVLKRPETPHQDGQFVILCPTFLRRPVTISTEGWAGY